MLSGFFPFLMKPFFRCNVVGVDPEDSLEIDTPYNLKLAEFLISNKN